MILFYLLFLVFSKETCGETWSLKCVKQIEDYHQCNDRAVNVFEVSMVFRDGRRDFFERKACNYFIASLKCADVFTVDCFTPEELEFLRENDISSYSHFDEMLNNWDSEKCPPTKQYLDKLNNVRLALEGEDECQQAIKEFRSCRDRAFATYVADLKAGSDGREDYKERKMCNLDTAFYSSCPTKVPSTCVSNQLWQKYKFWEMIDDKNLEDDHENWESEKCPVVKDIIKSWNETKNSIPAEINAVQVFRSNDKIMSKAHEYKGLIFANKIQNIQRSKIAELPHLLKTARENLTTELKKKAVGKQANAIVGLKMEVHSIFDGVLNVALYGTAVSI